MSKLLTKRDKTTLVGCFATIPLSHGLFAIIDFERYEEISKHHWRAVRSGHCFYAVRRVRHNRQEIVIYLHRVIAKTPPGYNCHHKNRYTLDCREDNLENLLPKNHAAEHGRIVV